MQEKCLSINLSHTFGLVPCPHPQGQCNFWGTWSLRQLQLPDDWRQSRKPWSWGQQGRLGGCGGGPEASFCYFLQLWGRDGTEGGGGKPRGGRKQPAAWTHPSVFHLVIILRPSVWVSAHHAYRVVLLWTKADPHAQPRHGGGENFSQLRGNSDLWTTAQRAFYKFPSCLDE